MLSGNRLSRTAFPSSVSPGRRRIRLAGLRAVAFSVAALVAAAPTPPAGACPVCNTTTGRQVRAGIFDGHFGRNLLLTLLPVPFFAALVAAIYFGPPPWPSRFNRRERPSDAPGDKRASDEEAES